MSDRPTSKPEANEKPGSRVDAPTVATVARGRGAQTPFLLVGGTALVMWSVAALAAGIGLVVWWLG